MTTSPKSDFYVKDVIDFRPDPFGLVLYFEEDEPGVFTEPIVGWVICALTRCHGSGRGRVKDQPPLLERDRIVLPATTDGDNGDPSVCPVETGRGSNVFKIVRHGDRWPSVEEIRRGWNIYKAPTPRAKLIAAGYGDSLPEDKNHETP